MEINMTTDTETSVARSRTRPPRKNSVGEKLALKLVTAKHKGRKLELRDRFGMNREVFARMLPVSTRTLATIESGQPASDDIKRKLIEMQRIYEALVEIMHPESVGDWMTTPNHAFGGLKPLEVVERGEVDRIWHMVFLLRSGVPS